MSRSARRTPVGDALAPAAPARPPELRVATRRGSANRSKLSRGAWPRSGRSRRRARCRSIASNDATTSASSVSPRAEAGGEDRVVAAEQLVQEGRTGSRRPSTPWSRSGGRGCRTGCPAASAMSRTVVFVVALLGEQLGGGREQLARRPARAAAVLWVSASWAHGTVACSGMLAADGDDLAGHVRGVVAGQEDDHVGDLPRLGGAAERLAAGQLGQQLVAWSPWPGAGAWPGSGDTALTRTPCGGGLERRAPGQRHHAGLGGGVVRLALLGPPADRPRRC